VSSLTVPAVLNQLPECTPKLNTSSTFKQELETFCIFAEFLTLPIQCFWYIF